MLFTLFTISLVFIASSLGVPITNSDASCSPVQLVHLAGTNQEGLGTVGIPLAVAISSAIPGTTTYTIPYDTKPEYVKTVANGAIITTKYLTSQAAKCPNQRFVLSGFSKGALVIHTTLLPGNIIDKVLAILTFGDPLRNFGLFWPIRSPTVAWTPRNGYISYYNIASFCNAGDLFCEVGGLNVQSHLAYGTDGSTSVAANFVTAKAREAGLI
ncbi:hypothetical protein FRC12_012315 [Ceratobasidium sp. 428]|nr:hypothetical protein FRC12_012315 [Ceratobasidium sp. 428]